jgi:UDP:flavonoid glycosyltransferase YjiC (YdhE family)
VQIIIPQWLNCYDYAAQVDYMGHGIYANRDHPMEIESSQLADALERALEPGQDAKKLQRRADKIAAKCKEAGGLETAS